MTKILDGISLSCKMLEELKEQLALLEGRAPTLAAVLTSDNMASMTYVSKKVAACRQVGIASKVIHTSPRDTQELVSLIQSLNVDHSIDGILLQLPVPTHIDLRSVIEHVDPNKDVDGFHPLNVGKVLLGDTSAFYPCTPLGIMALLAHFGIQVETKHVVIVGRSNIVGKPLASILLQNAPGCNATVTVAHKSTQHLEDICKTADILVAACGKPHIITADMVKEGAVVVDVGINKIEDPSKKVGYRLVGDVDFQNVVKKVSAITPVPGGVGPMTIAMLLKNTYTAFLRKTNP